MRASAIVEISIEVGFRSGLCAIISRCILCAFYAAALARPQPITSVAFLCRIITLARSNHLPIHFGRGHRPFNRHHTTMYRSTPHCLNLVGAKFYYQPPWLDLSTVYLRTYEVVKYTIGDGTHFYS